LRALGAHNNLFLVSNTQELDETFCRSTMASPLSTKSSGRQQPEQDAAHRGVIRLCRSPDRMKVAHSKRLNKDAIGRGVLYRAH